MFLASRIPQTQVGFRAELYGEHLLCYLKMEGSYQMY